jgi:hypothetical protein
MPTSLADNICHYCKKAIDFTDPGWGVATNLITGTILYAYHEECLEESDEA